MNRKFIRFVLTFLLIMLELMINNYNNLSSVLAQSRTTASKITFPRPKGTPSAKNATGSRGVCPKLYSLGGLPDYTLTVSEYLTFWFYVPQSIDKISNMEFGMIP
jgi:hypothetical protein